MPASPRTGPLERADGAGLCDDQSDSAERTLARTKILPIAGVALVCLSNELTDVNECICGAAKHVHGANMSE